jgi:predicted short-subunit dehydrogenase-like oxidoreductase (DUF2520 family)
MTLRVFVLGAGKVGCALARELRSRHVPVALRAARKALPRAIDADVIVLAVRERELRVTAERLAGAVERGAVVVHVAGLLGPEPIASLRAHCAGVAQMHPMISFASTKRSAELTRGNMLVDGDRTAVARARRLARILGMTPRTIPRIDRGAYHAAAGLVANGGATLAAVGAELLERAGVPRATAPKMLGPLLRSVAENIEALGVPHALTGPVRRGDAHAVETHLATLRLKLPSAVALYVAAAEAQLPLARALGEATPANLRAIARALRAFGDGAMR